MVCQQCSKSQWVLFAPGVRLRRMENQHVVVRCHAFILIAPLLFGFPVFLSVFMFIYLYCSLASLLFIVVFNVFL